MMKLVAPFELPGGVAQLYLRGYARAIEHALADMWF